MKVVRKKFIRSVYQFLMNATLRLVQGAMAVLPQPVIIFFVDCLYVPVSLGVGRLRNICINNMHALYGDAKTAEEYYQAANRYIKSVGQSMVDLIYYIERPQKLSEKINIHGEENLIQALGKGRGVLAVSAHMGNFPLMFVSLAQKGYKVNVIIRRMRDPEFSGFMYRLCAKWGINMIQTSPPKQFFRESLGALKRNELLFILLDEVVAKQDGVEVDFLNGRVTRATGPLLFVKRTASPILPVFVSQDEQKHFHIFVEPEFTLHSDGSDEENTINNIGGLTNIIEGYVRRYPFQWGGWFNRRWAEERSRTAQSQ